MTFSPMIYLWAESKKFEIQARAILNPPKRGLIPCAGCGIFVREGAPRCNSCDMGAPSWLPPKMEVAP